MLELEPLNEAVIAQCNWRRIAEVPFSANEVVRAMNESADTGSEKPGSSEDVERIEIEQYLENDESRLGDVYRGLRDDLSAEEIAAQLGVTTAYFVWNYSKMIDALLDRKLPQAPTVALQSARKFRTLLKREWSPAVHQRLIADLAILESRATDVEAIAKEVSTAQKQTENAEKAATTGIYVYALPHYLRYPFDPESGRTLLKVGRSDRDVIVRMREQTRTTALPEEPVLLRIYPTDEAKTSEVETRIHKTLRAFDHGRIVERMAGREWFLTTTQALDALADLMNLSPIVVNDDADFLEDS